MYKRVYSIQCRITVQRNGLAVCFTNDTALAKTCCLKVWHENEKAVWSEMKPPMVEVRSPASHDALIKFSLG